MSQPLIVRSRFRANRFPAVFRLDAAAALLTAVAGMILAASVQAEPLQPVRFNHQVHVKQMTCIFCHRFYETREIAGRPELFRCMLCHAFPVSKSPEADKLRLYAEKQEPIPWARLTRVQPFVRFSHQRHVVTGKVECVACHGDIAATTAPPPAPLVAINMQLCLDCHTARAVQLAPRASQALKAENLRTGLLEGVQELQGKRFASSRALVAEVNHLAGPMTEAEARLITGQVHPARQPTTDCFACHR